MRALDGDDAARGEPPWETVGPSGGSFEEGRRPPRALSTAEIAGVVDRFADAAVRAADAGFRVLEIHGAHGYLIHQFLSETSNRRTDGYGGTVAGRIRLAVEIAESVRARWPDDRPLLFRVSAGDGSDPGWTMDDTIYLVKSLAAVGVDVIDCSSGGIGLANYDIPGRRLPGFQVRLASRIRAATGVTTMAVGLIRTAREAERVLASGQADLIAIGREALYDPRWPLRAAAELDADEEFARWPVRYGWWLAYRARTVRQA
jgi:2,4-dienoyl-CoA reductase-like NADH-dependent reductase (Old Yellow Enzyme family)